MVLSISLQQKLMAFSPVLWAFLSLWLGMGDLWIPFNFQQKIHHFDSNILRMGGHLPLRHNPHIQWTFEDSPSAKSRRAKLIPIDHGLSLPDRLEVLSLGRSGIGRQVWMQLLNLLLEDLHLDSSMFIDGSVMISVLGTEYDFGWLYLLHSVWLWSLCATVQY